MHDPFSAEKLPRLSYGADIPSLLSYRRLPPADRQSQPVPVPVPLLLPQSCPQSVRHCSARPADPSSTVPPHLPAVLSQTPAADPPDEGCCFLPETPCPANPWPLSGVLLPPPQYILARKAVKIPFPLCHPAVLPPMFPAGLPDDRMDAPQSLLPAAAADTSPRQRRRLPAVDRPDSRSGIPGSFCNGTAPTAVLSFYPDEAASAVLPAVLCL